MMSKMTQTGTGLSQGMTFLISLLFNSVSGLIIGVVIALATN